MEEYQQPIFILGSQRSGTTMLRLMLNAHPDIAVPHESAFITEMVPMLKEYGDLSESENAEKLLNYLSKLPLVVKGQHIKDKRAILANRISSYQDLVLAIFHEYMKSEKKSVWCDKTPFYTDKIDVLYSLFPKAKFVHVVRDGRDVAISQKKIAWLPRSMPIIAERWRWKTTICHKVGSVLPPNQFYEVRYEDLVRESIKILQDLCQFIGVSYNDNMISYHQKASTVVPDGSLRWHHNSVRRPDSSKVYAWKNNMSKADQIIFEQVAGDTLELFGYERQRMPSSISSKVKNFYYSTIMRY